MVGQVRVGVGGWSFAPWRGVLYPRGLPHTEELSFTTRNFATLEINATFYSNFPVRTWRKWRDSAPSGFVYAVKAPRFATHRKVLAEAGPSVSGFLSQGLTELAGKLGPINWQFSRTKRFEATDFEAFLELLPRMKDGLTLRHAIEIRHPSFEDQAFVPLCRHYGVAIVYAEGKGVPTIDADTADFRYLRLMKAKAHLKAGLTAAEVAHFRELAVRWSRRGDVFAYMISAAKVRNPAAAIALETAIAQRNRSRVKRRAQRSFPGLES